MVDKTIIPDTNILVYCSVPPKHAFGILSEKYENVRESVKELSADYDINLVSSVAEELPGAVVNAAICDSEYQGDKDSKIMRSIISESLENMNKFLKDYLNGVEWIRQEVDIPEFLEFEEFYKDYLNACNSEELNKEDFREKPIRFDPGDLKLLEDALYIKKTNMYDEVTVGSEDRHIRGPGYKDAIEDHGIEVIGLNELIKKSEEEFGGVKV